MDQNVTNSIQSFSKIAVRSICYSYFHILSCATLVLAIFCLTLPTITLGSESPQIESTNKVKTIGITEIVEHAALEESKAGILSVLKEAGYIKGKNLKIIHQNAQGNIANAAIIAQNFVHANVDAIVAISTPSAQSVTKAARGTSIPVVFATVTDPVAAGIVKNLDSPEDYITGSTDYPPTEELFSLIEHIIPNLKTIGVLYNNGEANSVKTVELFKITVGSKWKIIESVAANSSQINQALYKLVDKVDAIYIPSDNTMFASMPNIVQITRKHKVPVFANEPTAVKQGCFASSGYSQYEVGRVAGKLLVKMLNGEQKLKVEKPLSTEILINKKTAELLGIAVSDNINGKIVKFVE